MKNEGKLAYPFYERASERGYVMRLLYPVKVMKRRIIWAIPYDQESGKTHCTKRWLERALSTYCHKVDFHQALQELEQDGIVGIYRSGHGYDPTFTHQGGASCVIELKFCPWPDLDSYCQLRSFLSAIPSSPAWERR